MTLLLSRPSTVERKVSSVENVEKLSPIGQLSTHKWWIRENESKYFRSSRKRHEYLHENPTSIACNICNKKFTRKSQLRKHTAKFHPSAVFQLTMGKIAQSRKSSIGKMEKKMDFIMANGQRFET